MEYRMAINWYENDGEIYRKIIYRIDQAPAIMHIFDGEFSTDNYEYNLSADEYDAYLEEYELRETENTNVFNII